MVQVPFSHCYGLLLINVWNSRLRSSTSAHFSQLAPWLLVGRILLSIRSKVCVKILNNIRGWEYMKVPTYVAGIRVVLTSRLASSFLLTWYYRIALSLFLRCNTLSIYIPLINSGTTKNSRLSSPCAEEHLAYLLMDKCMVLPPYRWQQTPTNILRLKNGIKIMKGCIISHLADRRIFGNNGS